MSDTAQPQDTQPRSVAGTMTAHMMAKRATHWVYDQLGRFEKRRPDALTWMPRDPVGKELFSALKTIFQPEAAAIEAAGLGDGPWQVYEAVEMACDEWAATKYPSISAEM